jgi:hypothetical protein
VPVILSIVVPIRQYTIETHYMILSLLASPEKRIEIILGENKVDSGIVMSTQLVEAKEEALRDPRVRYCPSSKYLSMSENWARSLKQSSGEYVAIIGADDGIVSENLAPLVDFLEICNENIILTSYTTFGYAILDEKPFVHFQEGSDGKSITKVKFHPLVNALFLGTRELMMPVIFNKSVARRSLLIGGISDADSIPGIAPDNYLTHYIMHREKKGIFVNLPVFISGSSELSNGRSQVRNPMDPIFQQYSLDHYGRRGELTKRFSLSCLPAGMLEDYLSASNRKSFLHGFFLSKCAIAWIVFSCQDPKHHSYGLFKWTLKARANLMSILVRVINRSWILRHFGFNNPFHAKTMTLAFGSTILDVQSIINSEKASH